jgi:MSHA biogenesis protein MshI
VDAGMPGEWMLASVQTPRGIEDKPRVLQVGQSSGEKWESVKLASLLDTRGHRSGKTVAVLPRGDYQLMLIPRPPVPAAELERSVRWAMSSQVDFSVEDAVLVTMELPPVQTSNGSAPTAPPEDDTRSLYVVVAQAQVIETVTQAFKEAGQRLDAIDVRETAQRNMAALVEKPDECLCLLRITPLGIQLTFTHRGELYLDRYIAQAIDVLKGSDDFERQRLIERVVQQTLVSVNHIQTNHAGMSVKRVVLCPLPVPLEIESTLKEQLNLPVEKLDLSTVLDLSAVPLLQDEQQQARYFSAIGAALRGQGARP